MLSKNYSEKSTCLQSEHVPLIIARPAIVVNSVQEPVPYYVD